MVCLPRRFTAACRSTRERVHGGPEGRELAYSARWGTSCAPSSVVFMSPHQPRGLFDAAVIETLCVTRGLKSLTTLGASGVNLVSCAAKRRGDQQATRVRHMIAGSDVLPDIYSNVL